jgi:hypothetical protein
MQRRIAAAVSKLFDVIGHQRALNIVVKRSRCRVKRQRIELAAKRFGITNGTPLWTQMLAVTLDADTTQSFLFTARERDSKRGVTSLDMAAATTVSTAIKQHELIRSCNSQKFRKKHADVYE